MALPARGFSLPFILLLQMAGTAGAQSLGQTRELDRLFDVAQFGVPREARFVFCDGEECPQRSIKHLQVAPAQSPRFEQPELPVPESELPEEESPRVQVPPKPRPLKKKRSKPPVRYECKPVPRGK
ncbi:MAG: hypothetical protein RLZZ555_2006 [Pseudomonadota bacterium]|jgi:hypothetical protein